MFDFLKNIIGGAPSSILGVDIGTTSIKVVELSKGGSSPHLKNYAALESYGHFERSNNVIQANAVKISERETILLLKALFSQAKFSTKNVIASIPSFASFITLIEMPSMNEEETNKAMAFQIRQSVPLPISDIAVDWIRVGERTDENGFTKQQILLIAIPNDIITRYKNIFKQVGLKLKALEVENLAYVRSLIGGDKTPTLIVDIGARSTNASIVDQGFLKHNTQIDYAGDTLTQAITKGLGISYKRAEELKKQRGISGGAGEYELSTLELPFLDVIISEVKKVKDNFERNLGAKIQRTLLVGGGANLIGIDKYFEEQIGITCVLGNGLLFVNTPSQLSVVTKELQTRFAIATGLAIKNFL
ncbi:MAG TPA: type IV pilus assembly protein PilM [Candidatus Paceibacterota bacterium]|mgnify:FL=1|nr:type IV pilus assembly protein PilM [Candidatus Paceibacterota bacterium]